MFLAGRPLECCAMSEEASIEGSPPASRRSSPGTIVIIVLVALVVVGAFVVVTKTSDMEAPSADELDDAFVPVGGYEYVEMPPESLEPLRAAFASQDEADIAHFDARELTQAGETSAVVFILSVDPDSMVGEFEDSYVTGFSATTQADVQDAQFGSTAGHIAETPMGTIAFFFDADGFAFNVVGRDTATVESIARSLEAGNS